MLACNKDQLDGSVTALSFCHLGGPSEKPIKASIMLRKKRTEICNKCFKKIHAHQNKNKMESQFKCI